MNMHLDEYHGLRGLKQIYRSLQTRMIEKEEAECILERHTQHYLNRCFPDWIR